MRCVPLDHRVLRTYKHAKEHRFTMNPICLMYHDVIDGVAINSGFSGLDADSYKLDTAQFKAHLQAIAAVGRPVCTITEPARYKSGSILFTFDDGGASAEPTAKLLEGYGWRGHFFIVTSKLGQPGFLRPEQVTSLHRRGHVIGSHSHTHPPRFSDLSYAEMVREWGESRRILTDLIGEAPRVASVPGGFYSHRVADAAREAGFNALFNSVPTTRTFQREGLLVIGRYWTKRNTVAAQVQTIARGDIIPRLEQWALWNAKLPLKTIGGTGWLAARRWLYSRARGTD